MILRALAALTLLGLVGAGLPSSGDARPETLPELQRLRLEEAFRLAERTGPGIWPGFDASEAPVLLVVGETEYLLNRERPPEGFTPIEGDTFRSRPVFRRARVLPQALLATFPAIGESTVIVGTAEATGRSPTRWVLTVVHELFHVFQAGRGLNEKIEALAIGSPEDPSWHLEFPFPYGDDDVARAMHLLGYNLFRTVTDDPPNEAEIRYAAGTADEAMSNLLRLLALRFDDARNGNYLRYQVAKEGFARYFEYRVAEAAASDEEASVDGFLESEGARPYDEVWHAEYGMSQLYQLKHLGSVSRNRVEFYSLGLGIGMALDRLGADWKSVVLEPGVWPDAMLHDAVAYPVAPEK
jgi:hypothetical protein